MVNMVGRVVKVALAQALALGIVAGLAGAAQALETAPGEQTPEVGGSAAPVQPSDAGADYLEAVRQAVAAKMRYQEAVRQAVAAKMRYQEAVRQAVAAKMRREAQQAAMRAALTALWMPGGFSNPAGGAWITSGPGYRWHPVYGIYRCHAGVDYAAGWGAPILASAPGSVRYAGWGGPPLGADYGNLLVVDHGGGVETAYAHLWSFAVSPGQVVGRGQVIGYAGSTGASTGPHLHFELRFNGAPQDPRGWVQPADPGLRRPACV
ncbi:MAG: M23 family metallopeptidase [Actinobacteria bacterium]|nr:M23 family metallopeptidase [Actinomycetota bacterium]MCB9413024.1 M23 family metallopeptidase [Actinomycetota bacterium]